MSTSLIYHTQGLWEYKYLSTEPVGNGKGGEALNGFVRRLKSSKCKIQAVAMQKVECNIKPYFNYSEKNGESLVSQDL